jgi:hypothetical protein
MREIMQGAMNGARDMLTDVVGDWRQERMTDQEVVQRYEREHANNPFAVLEFARQSLGAPTTTSPEVVQRALEYEMEMERLRAQANQSSKR